MRRASRTFGASRSALGALFLGALLSLGGFPAAEASAPSSKWEELLRARTATVFVEGRPLGDLILNARARVEVIYVDGALSEALVKNPIDTPERLRMEAQYYGSERLRGKALFVIFLSTAKPWTVEPGLFRIGGYALREEDVLTPRDLAPLGEMPSGVKAAFAVAVPGADVRPGSTIVVAVSGDEVPFIVPRR
jgi:hypothetical protein